MTQTEKFEMFIAALVKQYEGFEEGNEICRARRYFKDE
jgi:hypothetical protein